MYPFIELTLPNEHKIAIRVDCITFYQESPSTPGYSTCIRLTRNDEIWVKENYTEITQIIYSSMHDKLSGYQK
jgi:hypothetical protein